MALAALCLQVLLLQESLSAPWADLLHGRAGHARLFAAAATIATCYSQGFNSGDCTLVSIHCGNNIGFICSDDNSHVCVCENTFNIYQANYFRRATPVGTKCDRASNNGPIFSVNTKGCTIPGQYCDEVREGGALAACITLTLTLIACCACILRCVEYI